MGFAIKPPALIVIPATAIGQLSQDVQSPPAGQQPNYLAPMFSGRLSRLDCT
jgi:hypothetical protein